MKKILLMLANICLIFSFFSCKEKPLSPIEQQAVAQNEAVTLSQTLQGDTAYSEKIDYDLSEMNSDLVYASVFQMMIEPESFTNKVIKMRGNFTVYENSPTMNGGRTYAVIISDALACCKQGIEFHYDFNGNEPKDGDVVTVTGVYTTGFLPDDVQFNFVQATSVEM
ncbi:MAG: hypothetical protein II821_01820 [Treponema sp.]|nr:hypothetical protein [Treponema sp.]